VTDAEVRWPTFDLEFGAVVFGTKSFRPYLLHAQCQWVVLSDHAPLTHWDTHGLSLTLRQIRQLDHLSQFDFRWEYLPGSKMLFADLLSRRPGAMICYDDVQPSFKKADCPECACACGHDAGRRIAAALAPAITTSATTATTTTSVSGSDDIDVSTIVQNYRLDPYTCKINAHFSTAARQRTFIGC
jgi:hypothetical protein